MKEVKSEGEGKPAKKPSRRRSKSLWNKRSRSPHHPTVKVKQARQDGQHQSEQEHSRAGNGDRDRHQVSQPLARKEDATLRNLLSVVYFRPLIVLLLSLGCPSQP
uniref:Uncharacterized protein n=1 Tax=Marmota marmota marmota TaxID=9994 RepID=A0A8C5Z9R3_MARMA